jgi:hypothetical protein
MAYVVALGYFARKLAVVCGALVDNNRVTIIASTAPPPPRVPALLRTYQSDCSMDCDINCLNTVARNRRMLVWDHWACTCTYWQYIVIHEPVFS